MDVDHIFRVRLRLLKGMLVALVTLGLPAVIIACMEAFEMGQINGVVLYGLIYLANSATLLFFHRLPFAFSAGVMLGSLYLIGVFSFIHFSFAGAGIELSITISVLATVLLGIQTGLVTAAICLFTLITIGLCFLYHLIGITPSMPSTSTQAVSWWTAALVFSLLSGSLVLSVGMLQEFLIRSLKSVRHKTKELQKSNEYLTREIKQRKETEKKLKHSQEQFKTLFETAPDAIYLTDMEGAFLDGNRKTEVLLENSRDVFIGKNLMDMDLLPETEFSKASALLEKNRFGKGAGPDEFTLITPSGKTITVEILTRPFNIENRSAILGIARDISERKRLENSLLQAQKMESVGRLAGGVAHDFNNMLSIILGNTELALDVVDRKEPVYSNLLEIQKATLRSTSVVRQLLAFARKQTIAPVVLDLNQTVEEMLKMLRRLIGEDIDLSWYPGNNIWPIKVDPSQIDQILANLSVNARDAITGVGKLTIETDNVVFDNADCENHPGTRPGDFVLLAVSDDGCGMDEKTRENLFEPFFTTKEVGKGTGLGLAMVYGIVKQNKGFIYVYSEPNKGSSFKIYLPRHTASLTHVRQKGQANPVLRGKETVLLVEDEPSILKMTTQMLQLLGYTVLTAVTPGKAIHTAREHGSDIHLLMTDIVMPEMNGRDLAENLLSLYPDLKCLFMSGYTADVIAHHGVLDEDVHFIQKPFSTKDLSVKIRKALDKSDGLNRHKVV